MLEFIISTLGHVMEEFPSYSRRRNEHMGVCAISYSTCCSRNYLTTWIPVLSSITKAESTNTEKFLENKERFNWFKTTITNISKNICSLNKNPKVLIWNQDCELKLYFKQSTYLQAFITKTSPESDQLSSSEHSLENKLHSLNIIFHQRNQTSWINS